ncbi:MAG: hypothetical protein KC464_09815, partial [Myxococcales bacterium]|nr:hypothetical protein [Myxococcales bacterium]
MSRAGATYVFLGPSLPVDEARRVLDAIYLPPAAVGDLWRLVRDGRPVRVAIVDGYFERMAAVWHKEILAALQARVEVWGAASMGALRAAELAPFGMIGVGRVYAGFRAGRLTDDDEVAVAHLPAAHGYQEVSTAMVELRAGLGRARRAGALSPRDHDRLVALAKARFYRERSWVQLDRDAADAGVSRAARTRLARVVDAAGARLDVKAADAR